MASIVTWLGRGATQPALGLARELSARGKGVRVLALARLARRIAAAGSEHVALQRQPSSMRGAG